MTVKKLIEALQKMSPSSIVAIKTADGSKELLRSNFTDASLTVSGTKYVTMISTLGKYEAPSEIMEITSMNLYDKKTGDVVLHLE